MIISKYHISLVKPIENNFDKLPYGYLSIVQKPPFNYDACCEVAAQKSFEHPYDFIIVWKNKDFSNNAIHYSVFANGKLFGYAKGEEQLKTMISCVPDGAIKPTDTENDQNGYYFVW